MYIMKNKLNIQIYDHNQNYINNISYRVNSINIDTRPLINIGNKIHFRFINSIPFGIVIEISCT